MVVLRDGIFRPLERQGGVDIWVDRLMRGGDNWNPEIERKLRTCDIFVLLVSPNSLSSDYIVDKEIAIIRERQANGEDVHFFPLLLKPTPRIALRIVSDRNLRPRDARPLSSYSLSDSEQQMTDAADEIESIAEEIAKRKSTRPVMMNQAAVTSRTSAIAGARPTLLEVDGRDSLETWFGNQTVQTALAVAARCLLRVVPLAVVEVPLRSTCFQVSDLASAAFQAAALARVLAKFPHKADELRSVADSAVGAAASAAIAAADAGDAAANAALAAARHAGRAASALAATPDQVARACAFAADSAAAACAFAAESVAEAAPADAAWREIRSDLAMSQESHAPQIVDLPIWARGVLLWAKQTSARLRTVLPSEEGWEVWEKWYKDRLHGGSRGEAYEMVFVSAPSELIWKPAAINSWIKKNLPKDFP